MDGPGEDGSEGESDEGTEDSCRLLAAECDALEAFELADRLLDAGAPDRALSESKRAGTSRWTCAGSPARCRARAPPHGSPAGVTLIARRRAGRDVGAEIEQNLELHARRMPELPHELRL